MAVERQTIKGRGTSLKVPNRFERIHAEDDWEHLENDGATPEKSKKVATEYFEDQTSTIITSNDSPDVFFDYSVNAYRGCEHGCAYCYARPGHEYLGFNAGLDFETRIMVKLDAPKLLRDELSKPSWKGELIAMSGVTDCYQPAERRFGLTRGLLEVMLEARQVTGIITKNALVTRDVDLLAEMAELRLANVHLSVTTLDQELARKLEPRTSPPAAKLAAIRTLSEAGVPVGVMIAPVIPGLNDHEIPQILKAVAEAGALRAGYVLLRLPHAVKPIFLEWIAEHYPDKRDRIEAMIRDTRDGGLYQNEWGVRQRGTGRYAEQIEQSFAMFTRKFGVDRPLPKYDHTLFRPPRPSSGQMNLF